VSEPRRIDVRGLDPAELDLGPVIAHLAGGGLLVYPTETVYGIGCQLHAATLETLRWLKLRGPADPFLLLVSGREGAPGLVWTAAALEMARIFWPGALTLVLADPGGRFPGAVRSAKGAVAVRRSSHPLAARIVSESGEALVSTSANAHGELPARNGDAALTVARRLGGGSETWVLDAGELPWSAPSTIVDCTGPVPSLVRAGSIPVDRLRCVLPEIHGATTE
jgi:tRNA threonylcarbamoyl adenosine modification protein (Sua5/YciO/YrdC/YwlC family)